MDKYQCLEIKNVVGVGFLEIKNVVGVGCTLITGLGYF